MKTANVTLLLLLGLAAVMGTINVQANNLSTDDAQLAHMVYFELKDHAAANQQKLVGACNEYLSGHEGTVYFSAGVIAADFKREVNDQNFDVALNLVFKNKAAHDTYQTHPRHLKFIEENKQTWQKVRVFDSYIEPQPKQ